ncbi:MAG: hypothetical protein ACJ75Z_03225 [Solirubrobacterales bacterium]
MGEGPLSRFARIKHPVARDEGLLVEELTDETVVFDEVTKEAHCLSPLAAIVFANCDGSTTISELATLATERLGEPVDESHVIDALAQLQDRDLLSVPPRDGFNRRQMIGKSAVAAGGAFAGASLITSIMAPAAIASNSANCRDVTCCPCCAGGAFDKPACCTSPGTVNCQCSSATRLECGGAPNITAGSNPKFCKPAGNSYFTDQLCQNLYCGCDVAANPGCGTQAGTDFRAACVTAQSYPARPNENPAVPAGAGASCRTCV